ncbi:E3 ubiquitin/ISG15 ligase TRIM25-like isoform X2 [Dendropsophus ebraccatus]|uniref:E3 ubiquitin/ISG15 ligase TRIM25-like isoform X2 n=1 Tax=Dendropsophus ebraccatus TaxID=150705 RepID=UPI00383136FC
MAQSLDEMAEELTCSICLSLFTTPVSLPCGHNFCSQCLDLSWKGVEDTQYSCPQCRYVFSTKPELRKNTLLSNLVSQVIAARKEDPDHQEEEEEEEDKTQDSTPDKGDVLCDSCRKEAASKTCLTCMASFCQEHLMPHLQSPAFLDHLLSQPLRDLKQRKCAEHNKLMDHYCWEHGQCLCCYCALGHKTCKTYSLREAKHQKELHYTNMLRSVNQKIVKATSTAEEVKTEQRRLLENTRKKKELLEAEYEEIKNLIDEERRRAMAKIEEEEKKVTSKFIYTQSVLNKKKLEYERMSSRVQSLLQEEDDLSFLKKAAKLKDVMSKDPYKPKTEFDEKLLHNIYRNAVSLKELVRSSICQIAENPEWRPPTTKKTPGAESGAENTEWRRPPTKKTGAESGATADETIRQKSPRPPTPQKPEEKPNKNKTNVKKKPKATGVDDSKMKPEETPPSASAGRIPDSRELLMMHAEKLSADPRTIHKKILAFDLLTTLSVSDLPQNYSEDPQSFAGFGSWCLRRCWKENAVWNFCATSSGPDLGPGEAVLGF